MIKKSRNSEKQNLKQQKLYSSAFDLFMEKGINNTAIDEIVKNAGVAKGTFYLYFKDKYDIINKIIIQKSRSIFEEALKETSNKNIDDFDDMCLFFVGYVIDYFKENKVMLKFINKNFSWSLYKIAVMRLDAEDQVEKTVSLIIENLMARKMTREEAEITLFMVIELVGGVCYSSIINNEPTDIDTIKPILFKKVLAMVSAD